MIKKKAKEKKKKERKRKKNRFDHVIIESQFCAAGV